MMFSKGVLQNADYSNMYEHLDFCLYCFADSIRLFFRVGVRMGVKLQALKNLDAFPRAEEHLLQKTRSGAVGMCLFSFLSALKLCNV